MRHFFNYSQNTIFRVFFMMQGNTESTVCARCGETLCTDTSVLNTDSGCYTIPRRIIGEGIKSTKNCIAVCPKDYYVFRDKFPDDDIPMSEIPFYNMKFIY
jgi:hypothetical protein